MINIFGRLLIRFSGVVYITALSRLQTVCYGYGKGNPDRRTIMNRQLKSYQRILKQYAIGIIAILLFFSCTSRENTDYFEPKQGDFERNVVKEKFTITESNDKNTVDFELYADEYNEGFYDYYVWINAIDTGTVYLKTYKIGKIRNEPMRKLYSEMDVYNQSYGFVKCGPKRFVIYDDFGVENYLAKFELWYKPKNNGKEKKLLTKIYKVKGFID